MPAIKVVTYPSQTLLERSLPVVIFDGALRKLCSDLFDTMYTRDNAIGLSAIQVGIPLRVFVLNCGLEEVEPDGPQKFKLVKASGTLGPTVFINPELTDSSKTSAREAEGCLSLPGVSISVDRSDSVRIRATTVDGLLFDAQADGIFARAVQHELDHLDGKLLLSYVGYAKREMIKKKLSKGKR